MQIDELVYWLEKFVCDYCGVYPNYYESDYYEYSDSTKNITTCELKKYNIDDDFIVDLFCEGLDFRYTKNILYYDDDDYDHELRYDITTQFLKYVRKSKIERILQ